MENIIKSIFYLGGFTTLGYVLMKVTEPDQEKLKAIRNTTSYSDPQSLDNRRRTELIIQKLKEAAGEPAQKP
jgi:hypothetical protein